MRQYQPQWKLLISSLVVISSAVLIAGGWITGYFDTEGAVWAAAKIGTVSGIVFVLWEVFRRWGWKWKWVHGWLIDCPNIAGKWSGKIRSNFGSEEAKELPIEVTIRQTLTSVNVELQVATSRSYSVTASLVCDDEAGRGQLIYTYANEPKPLEPLDKHWGTAILHFDECRMPTRMDGLYMTERSQQTKGEIWIERVLSNGESHGDKHLADA